MGVNEGHHLLIMLIDDRINVRDKGKLWEKSGNFVNLKVI